MHVFKLNEEGPESEEIDDESDVTAASHWALPNGNVLYNTRHIVISQIIFNFLVNFQGMWENLIYDCNIKQTVCHKYLL